MSVKKMVTLAMFSVAALTIFIVESMIPPLLPIPGVKLGLANIITLIVLVFYSPKESLMVLLVRIILGSIFGGQAVSFAYSLAGGLFCFAVMSLLNKIFGGRYLVLTSMSGAIAHNIGQILAAGAIMQSAGVFAYLPVLMVSGLVTGCFTGFAARFSVRQLKKLHVM